MKEIFKLDDQGSPFDLSKDQVPFSCSAAQGRPYASSDSPDSSVITKIKPITTRPPYYKVILLNDDFTPMEFVIEVLKKFFNKTTTEAEEIMLQVHNQGSGVAGIYSLEIAETKAYQVNTFAQNKKHPLKTTLEKTS